MDDAIGMGISICDAKGRITRSSSAAACEVSVSLRCSNSTNARNIASGERSGPDVWSAEMRDPTCPRTHTQTNHQHSEHPAVPPRNASLQACASRTDRCCNLPRIRGCEHRTLGGYRTELGGVAEQQTRGALGPWHRVALALLRLLRGFPLRLGDVPTRVVARAPLLLRVQHGIRSLVRFTHLLVCLPLRRMEELRRAQSPRE